MPASDKQAALKQTRNALRKLRAELFLNAAQKAKLASLESKEEALEKETGSPSLLAPTLT